MAIFLSPIDARGIQFEPGGLCEVTAGAQLKVVCCVNNWHASRGSARERHRRKLILNASFDVVEVDAVQYIADSGRIAEQLRARKESLP